jgi:hypothetical protein
LAGEHWVRWNTNAAKRFQQMVAAIEQFDAGERLAAQASADGSRLIADALGTAAELARGFGATVLAVDPYDRETNAMWRERFGFRASRTRIGNADDDAPLKRLHLPIPSS